MENVAVLHGSRKKHMWRLPHTRLSIPEKEGVRLWYLLCVTKPLHAKVLQLKALHTVHLSTRVGGALPSQYSTKTSSASSGVSSRTVARSGWISPWT